MDTLFFLFSKLYWLVFSPATLLVWLLVGACLLSWSRWQKAGRYLLTGITVGVLFIACLPVGSWLIYPLEQRYPAVSALPEAPDGIVLLGGSFALRLSENRQQVHLNDTSERVTGFLALAQRYPDARLVFTGGSGSPTRQDIREADLARELFLDLGISPERLVLERDSRNTFENAVNTRNLIQPARDERWLLVTSAFHMPRAVGVFCKQGWNVQPYPVDYQSLQGRLLGFSMDLISNLSVFNYALHEWTGLLAYRLTGKSSSLFPGPGDNCQENY